MKNTTNKSAAWRDELTETERRELEMATAVRDAAVALLNAITNKMKNRCIKRLRRKKR